MVNGKAPPRVLVTRAPHQASELANHLRALGMEPVLVPAIEVEAPPSFAVLDRAIAELVHYDWLLFTSANAAEVFGKRLSLLAGQMPASLKVAAIGTATRKALEKLGIEPDLMPSQAVAESLTEALLPHAQSKSDRPIRFLLVRAEQARELLPETLRQQGAEVTIAPAYRTVIPETSVALLQSLFAERTSSPDAITFTSSSSARNLLALFEAANLAWPASALRVSIGPITTQTLQELGLPPHAESPEASVASLAETVAEHLKRVSKS